MLSAEALHNRCAALVGTARVQAEATDTAAYALGPLTPTVVVQPETAEQVAALLALAERERLAVVPWGQGTQMHLGGPPRRYDVALSLASLQRIVEYDSANLTLIAEAGVSLRQVYALTLPQRQFLPLGCPRSPQSLGGVLVTNRSGVKRLRYGAVRDLLLGVRVALPDGALVHFGGRVVKNVAGYDMNKLFLGSLGAFGVVVEATYRLTALPQDDRLLVVAFATPDQALQASAAVRAAALWPSALTILPAANMQAFPGILPPTVDSSQSVLCINYDGTYEAVERQMRESRTCCQPYRPVAEGVLAGATLLRLWEHLEAWRTAPPPSTAMLLVRCGVPPARLGDALALLTIPPACAPQEVAWLAEVGSGQIYARIALPEPFPETLGQRLQDWLQALRVQLQTHQGYAVVESAPASLCQQLDLWGHPAGGPLLQRYKQQFDPHGILNPGRSMAGL